MGDICIVECEGQLFRAEVVDTTDKDNTFTVRYVDYGDEQELNSCSLYAVDSQEKVSERFFFDSFSLFSLKRVSFHHVNLVSLWACPSILSDANAECIPSKSRLSWKLLCLASGVAWRVYVPLVMA